MSAMHLDHVSFAAGPEGLEATTQRLSALLGTPFREGGFHPRFGTRNKILPLTDGQYLEVVAVLDHPPAGKAPLGQAVPARAGGGGGWLGWGGAAGAPPPPGERVRPAAGEGDPHLD